MSSILTPEEQLKVLSDKIIARCLVDVSDRTVVFQLPTTLFYNENHVLYQLMHSKRSRGFVPDEEYLRVFLPRNPKLILQNKNVDQDMLTTDDKVINFTKSTISQLNKLTKVASTVSEDIVSLLEKYKEVYRGIEFDKIMQNAQLITKDEFKDGNKTLMGAEDASKYIKSKIDLLSSNLDTSKGMGILSANEIGMQDEMTQSELIGDFGDLEFLNEHYSGGIRAGYFYNILAPAKNGKSKFCYRIAHNACVKFKTPVAIWPQEGGYKKCLAELRAIHFDHYFKEKGVGGVENLILPAQSIEIGEYPSEEFRIAENESRSDLFESNRYPDIKIIDEDLRLDSFLDIMDSLIREHGIKLFIIDYLSLIGGDGKRSSSDVIGDAYKEVLSFIKSRDVALISPSQFKQEAIGALMAGKDVDLRTAGGESSQVIRTPDVNIALYGTEEELANGQMHMLSVPSRIAAPFAKRTIYCDLSIAYFSDLNE